MSKSDFGLSAILGAFGCYCAEGLNESGVFGAVHYVGGAVFGDIHELGGFVGVKVGFEVGALADCGACRLDGIMEKVGALIVREVVGFFDFAREGEAEPLFAMLSVVLVGSFKVGVEGDGCHFGAFLSRSYIYIISYSRAFVKGFFKKSLKNF